MCHGQYIGKPDRGPLAIHLWVSKTGLFFSSAKVQPTEDPLNNLWTRPHQNKVKANLLSRDPNQINPLTDSCVFWSSSENLEEGNWIRFVNNYGQRLVLMLINLTFVKDYVLPFRTNVSELSGLRFSGMLHSADCLLVTDVSGLPICYIFEGQTVFHQLISNFNLHKAFPYSYLFDVSQPHFY